jgi:hypothetical protein
MMPFKKWILIVMLFLVAFVGVNAAIWKLYTEDILTFKKFYNGGLDRMAYVIGSKHYRKPENTLPRSIIENKDYRGQHVDIVTIGDSFSNVKDNGKDPLYQSWIASLYGLNVLNLQPIGGDNALSTIVLLINSGYLDKIKPRYVIAENVERNCIVMYATQLDLGSTLPLSDIERYYQTAEYRSDTPDTGFINTGNFKFLLNSVLYRYSDHAFYSEVYVRYLNAPFFSVKNDRTLLFYKNDIKAVPLATPQNVAALNDNVNAVAGLLKKKGITLYFMPAADKYDMYSEYIVNNPYPRSVFFETLRPLPKQYVLVDTKAILSDDVRKGEKDVYYADDTHWSWKAVKKIAENITFAGPVSSHDRRTP